MTEPVTPTPAEPRERVDHADMRIEVVKRELNQGALAGFDSSVTAYAAHLVVAALDSYDAAALKAEYERGVQHGKVVRTIFGDSTEKLQAEYERGKAEAQVHAEVIVPCRDTREDLDGALCTGEFRYGPQDIQAKCNVCGGWRGRYAPAELTAFERGKAEGIAERLVGVDFLASIVCAVRDDPAHQAMAEDEVCSNCEEIAREIQQHVIAKTGGSDA